MKLLSILFAVVLATLSGCATAGNTAAADGATIQRALDAMLPPTFTGPAHIEHKNPYFGFTIDAGGLRRTPEGWHWDWLRYRRDGFFSRGSVSFGALPAGLLLQ